MVFKITNTLPAFLFSKITRKFKVTEKANRLHFLCDKIKSHATLKFYKKASGLLAAQKSKVAHKFEVKKIINTLPAFYLTGLHKNSDQKKEAVCASFLEENVVLPFEDISLGKRP